MFRFTAPFVPNNIFVIGAGGTGSRLIPLLAQFMRSITRGKTPNGWIENPTIWLADFDTVEEKNLSRQNFIRQDINKPKAVVLAERYERAFDTRIIPITERVDATNSTFVSRVQEILRQLNPESSFGIPEIFASSIVIICVDSVRARREILNTFCVPSSFRNNTFFIDAGNEDDYGQVSFFTRHIITNKDRYEAMRESDKLPKMIPYSVDVDFIPMDYRYYKELKDTESTASCADLNQTLAINALMATNIMGIVQNYFYRKPMNYNCVRVDLKGGNSVDYNTFSSYNRRAITDNEYSRIKYGEDFTVEKEGYRNRLNFGLYCSANNIVVSLYQPLKSQFNEAKAKEEAAKVAEEIRLKEEEIKAKQEAIRDSRAATIEDSTPVPVETVRPPLGHNPWTPIPIPRSETPRPARRRTTQGSVETRGEEVLAVDIPVYNIDTSGGVSPTVSGLPPLTIVPRVRNVIELPPLSEVMPAAT